MTTSRLRLLTLLLAAAFPAVAQDDATALLAKAVTAFQNNQKNENHWNWDIVETRQLLNRSGEVLQRFPSVTSESVILSNGRRCNALIAWGDGREPYMKDADPEDRCQAFNVIGTPFQVELLLNSANAKLIHQSSSVIRIAVLPDRSRTMAPDYGVRCAASIKATIQLDPATFFPICVEGEVTEFGCNGEFHPVVHYETMTRHPMVTLFRKGASFRVVYQLQQDKFDNPANSFWISTTQHYVESWDSDVHVLYYWGRQVPVRRTTGHRLVKDIRTTAQEFGAGSLLRFDK